jgi:hypothetical protein
MALPLSYNLRSRWQVTLFSVLGTALAALVLVTLSAMASGFSTVVVRIPFPFDLVVVRCSASGYCRDFPLLGGRGRCDLRARNTRAKPG